MPVKKHKSETLEQSILALPMRGEKLSVQNNAAFYPIYKSNNNALYEGDSIQWLSSLPTESVDLIFADPPYNIKKADWDKFESQEKYIEWSLQGIRVSSRVVYEIVTLYICGFFSEHSHKLGH